MTAVGHPSPGSAPQSRRWPADPDVRLARGALADPPPTVVRRQDLTLPPQPESVPAGRHFLKLMLREWGLQAATDTVELAASEILTNAVLHARASFEVTVVADDHLTVSVRDTGGSSPRHEAEDGRADLPGELSEGGRGLSIVAALADSWGMTQHGSGTTVWFRVRLPGV